MVWYSHLFQNFPQFIVIITVKGFGIVNKAEIDVFLELSCFFDDPADVGNLISGSSAFSETSLNIWKFTVHHSWGLLKLISTESVMPSNHLILSRPLLLLPPIPPSIRVFSNESTLRMRWPKYWRFSFSISTSNEYSGQIAFRMDWLSLLAVQVTQESSSIPRFKSISSLLLNFLYSPTLTSIHDYWKNHSFN